MNLIVYYLSITAATFFGLPYIGTLTEDPLYQKLIFFVATFVLHYLFYTISGLVRKELLKTNFSALTDKALMGSFALLFGLLMYSDLGDSTDLKLRFPVLLTIYPQRWFMTVAIMMPLVIISTTKTLFARA
tara:strand:- start:149 stop:541 length:393 start_codon:yes stop_codon:yes gene_type:complete